MCCHGIPRRKRAVIKLLWAADQLIPVVGIHIKASLSFIKKQFKHLF
ncbi:MAG: hypothetical protein LBS02_09020 [Hungatella sp.]|nr:hypothetical protein [Hungatella sp.]